MKRLTTAVTLAFVLIFFVHPIRADESQHSISIREVIEQIEKSHGVKDIRQLDCSDISEEEFEKLGEAVMAEMHPNEEEHNFMDQMMGGEGSESLRTAHIFMGKRYLGCANTPYGMTGYGMYAMMNDISENTDPLTKLINLLKLAIGLLVGAILLGGGLTYWLLKKNQENKQANHDSVKTKKGKRPARNQAKKGSYNKQRGKKRNKSSK